jgi:hypothetical protein
MLFTTKLTKQDIVAIRNEWNRIQEVQDSIPQMKIALCMKYGIAIDTVRRIGNNKRFAHIK